MDSNKNFIAKYSVQPFFKTRDIVTGCLNIVTGTSLPLPAFVRFEIIVTQAGMGIE